MHAVLAFLSMANLNLALESFHLLLSEILHVDTKLALLGYEEKFIEEVSQELSEFLP
jgi:hypothetical protein